MEKSIMELAAIFVDVFGEEELDPKILTLSYETLKERYRFVSHRDIPPNARTVFARLVAIHAVLAKRGVDAFSSLKGKGKEPGSTVTGVVRSISIGDSSTSFASSSGANLGEGGSDGAIDQNNELARSFRRLWTELIANTRRLL